MENIITDTTTAPPNLRVWRDRLKLKQVDAARLLGMSQAQYSRLERGLPTSGKHAKRLTKATGVPLEVLVGAV